MTISDWVGWVRSNKGAGQLNTQGLAALNSCDLFFVHIDELAAVTIAYVGSIGPEEALYVDADPAHTALEFFLRFDDVSDVVMTGWTYLPAHSLSIEHDARGGLQVAIRGEGTDLMFGCLSASLAKARTYIAGTL